MSKSIRLNPKYGLNPTMPQCFVCGEDKGEIALLGNAYKEEAPMKMVLDIKPCDKCTDKYLKEGVLLVEADRQYGKNGKPKMTPTGKFAIIKDQAFNRIFNCALPPQKIAYMEIGVLEKLNLLTAK